MKLFSSLLLLTLTTSSCVFAVRESPKAENRDDGDDRQLRIKRKKAARSFRRAVKPKGAPKEIADSNGNIKRRQSIVDLRELLLDDDEDDVDLQLMSDEDSQTLKLRRDDRVEDPFESWFGRDETTGNHLTMVKTKTPWGKTVTTGTMTGKNGTVYQIRTLADGGVVAEEVKPQNFDSELDGPRTDFEGDNDVDPETFDEIDGLPGGGRRGRRNLRRLDSSSQLDIMVLYTKAAMCSAAGLGSGGTCAATAANIAQIEGVIALAVAETNKAYELSGIPTKFRLVKTHFDATYDDITNQWEATLGYLHDNGDGKLDYVHAMRDQYGADFVSMLVDTGGYCGIGYKPATPTAGDAFSLVQWNCATGYYSFGHEIGHNMGCNHDMASAGQTGGSNYGYQDPAAQFRSILAYDCSPSCPRVQYFSNPNVMYNGKVIGSATANNAALIKSNLAAYANYRQAVVTSTAPPPASTPVPAPSTPAPTVAAPAASSLSLTTGFTGGYVGAEGNMFDIKAAKDLTVTNFAVHSSSASIVMVEVYKKKTIGRFLGTQSDPTQWIKIGQVTFTTNSEGQPSPLPAGSITPVFVKAGSIQAFYVTFTASTNLNRYSLGQAYGAVQVSNADLVIRHGYAKQYPFGQDFTLRSWNGILYYRLGSADRSRTKSIPTSTGASQADKLSTTFAGGNGQAGNMIEILASKSIVVQSFDIHTFSTGSVHAYVYVKKGSYVGFEKNPEAWTKIADTVVVGQGSPNPTLIPAKDVVPVTMNAGETYSFYITLSDGSIRYTNGQVMAENSVMKIVRSNGNKYPFGASYPNRIWNGVVNYVPADGTSAADEESEN